MRNIALRIGLGCIVCLCTLAAQPGLSRDSISSIEIHSTFQGLPPPDLAEGAWRDDLVITRSQGKFLTNGHVVPNDKINALISAISRAPRAIPLHEDFGLTSDWLKATADNAFLQAVYSGRSPGGNGFFSAAQRKMYIRYYKDMRIVSASLGRYYAGNFAIADDDHEVLVTLKLSDGGTVTVHSDSKAILMLPWVITQAGASRTTFDPAVANAIFSFLTPSDPNYTLLSRDIFLEEIPSLVADEISAEWSKVPKYNVKPLISALEKRYNVHLRPSYNPISPGSLVWDTALRWDDSPPNVGANARLPIVNNTILNTQAIPAARNFMLVATQLPWVQRDLKANQISKLEVELQTDSTISMTPGEQQTFLSNLRELGKNDRATAAATDMQKAFEIIIDQGNEFSVWIVFPNRDAILWTYYPDKPSAPILDLPLSALQPKECANGNPCSGLLRKPDGTIVP